MPSNPWVGSGRLFFMLKSHVKPPKCRHCGSLDVRIEPHDGFGVICCNLCTRRLLEPPMDDIPFEFRSDALLICPSCTG